MGKNYNGRKRLCDPVHTAVSFLSIGWNLTSAARAMLEATMTNMMNTSKRGNVTIVWIPTRNEFSLKKGPILVCLLSTSLKCTIRHKWRFPKLSIQCTMICSFYWLIRLFDLIYKLNFFIFTRIQYLMYIVLDCTRYFSTSKYLCLFLSFCPLVFFSFLPFLSFYNEGFLTWWKSTNEVSV